MVTIFNKNSFTISCVLFIGLITLLSLEALVYAATTTVYIFPVLWLYCILLWVLPAQKLVLTFAALASICAAPLYGSSIQINLMYILIITGCAHLLRLNFVTTPLVIFLFMLFSFLIFCICILPLSLFYVFINLAFIVALIGINARLLFKQEANFV